MSKNTQRKNATSATGGDSETDEILEEMREAGELDDSDEDDEEKDTDTDDGDDSEEAGDAGDEEDDEEDEDAKSKKKPAKKPGAGDAGQKGEDGDDEDEEEEDDADDDDDEDDPKLKDGKERKPKFVPLAKHKKKIDNLKSRQATELAAAKADYETRLAAASKSASKGEDVDDEVAAIAAEHGIPEESLSKIVELTAKKLSGAGLTDAQKRQLARLEEDDNDRVQEQGFQKELKALSKEDQAIKEHEEELREMAFSEEYGGLSLYEIFHRHLKPTLQPKKKTAEGSRGGARSTGTTYTDQEIAADPALQEGLSDEEFDAWTERMAKGSKATIRRNGKPIKRA